MPLTLENITYKAGSFEIRDLSLTINDADKVAIMGATGCGKSTLLGLFTGLENPLKGRLLLDGEEADIRKEVGILFQYPERQLFASTVKDDVLFALRKQKLSKDEKEKRLNWALSTMGFEGDEIRRTSPLSLSGGEKRRVAIAGVIITKPRFLFFDEPFAGLDPKARDDFEALTDKLNQEGIAIITVTHNSDAASKYNRLIVLDNGRIVKDSTPEEILSSAEKALHYGLEPSTTGLISSILNLQPTVDEDKLVDEIMEKWGGK